MFLFTIHSILPFSTRLTSCHKYLRPNSQAEVDRHFRSVGDDPTIKLKYHDASTKTKINRRPCVQICTIKLLQIEVLFGSSLRSPSRLHGSPSFRVRGEGSISSHAGLVLFVLLHLSYVRHSIAKTLRNRARRRNIPLAEIGDLTGGNNKTPEMSSFLR